MAPAAETSRILRNGISWDSRPTIEVLTLLEVANAIGPIHPLSQLGPATDAHACAAARRNSRVTAMEPMDFVDLLKLGTTTRTGPISFANSEGPVPLSFGLTAEAILEDMLEGLTVAARMEAIGLMEFESYASPLMLPFAHTANPRGPPLPPRE